MSWSIGRKHSPESIQRMRNAQKGRTISKAHRKKLSIAHKGKKLSEQHRLNIIEGRKYIDQHGENNPCWKGGKIIKSGYIMVKVQGHPFGTKNHYVAEHRLIMEKHLGRFLPREELVHHINGIKSDNRIENLVLISNAEHSKIHRNKEIDDGVWREMRPLFTGR